jgi:hypothetical protein
MNVALGIPVSRLRPVHGLKGDQDCRGFALSAQAIDKIATVTIIVTNPFGKGIGR